MKNLFSVLFVFLSSGILNAQNTNEKIYPSSTETVTPLHKSSFNNGNECPERKQGGNPKTVNGYQVFNGSMDGNRQVDPQIAVGGGYVMEGTNSGLLIYDKKGNFIQGVSQKCFNNGIDPKMFFDIHNKVFVFDLWWYYDKPKTKPVNISVSETSDPTGAWNTYPVSRTAEVDGGGIGYSKKWIGYSYPGGEENTFVLRMADAKAGKPATIYHFKGSLGHPVFMQDAVDDLYFFDIDNDDFVIRKVSEDADVKPYCQIVSRKAHGLKYIDYPPQSPQKWNQPQPLEDTKTFAANDHSPNQRHLQNQSQAWLD